MLYFGSQMVKNRTGWPARWALPRILVVVITVLLHSFFIVLLNLFSYSAIQPQVSNKLSERTAARLRPQCTSTIALFKHVSARRSTHLPCYHWRPCLPGGWSICLEQSVGVSTNIAITASRIQLFCSVLQVTTHSD